VPTHLKKHPHSHSQSVTHITTAERSLDEGRGLANLDTYHKHESESVWCQAHHVRNPDAAQGKLTT
jgi:hypothetical protein